MGHFFDLVNGWAERIAIKSISFLHPSVSKETLSKITTALNERGKKANDAIEDLKSKNPENLADLVNVQGIFKTLKPVILILMFIAGWYLFAKFYYQYKRRR